jgi:hypothetical protein
MALAVAPHLGLIELGEVQTEKGVRRQAVVTAIELCDGECDAFTSLGIERLTECAIERHIGLECRRAEAEEAEEVRNDAELFLDRLQQRFGSDRGLLTARSIEARHWQ